MSVHKRNGGWRVIWREGSKQRSRQFARKGDADAFDREIARRRQLGPMLANELLDTKATTLRDFYEGDFRAYAATLAPKTRQQYAWAAERHLRELMDEPVAALDVGRLMLHQQYLLDHGRTENTAREAMTRLSGILQYALELGRVPANYARMIRKPTVIRPDVDPLTPFQLEALLASLEGRDRVIMLLGGRLGLRPLEIRNADWRDLTEDGLKVRRDQTKRSAARTRIIKPDAATSADLKRWRLASGRPGDDEPIIGATSKHALVQWAIKRLAPVARSVIGRDDVTVKTLRHSHASALHYAGFTVPAAARRMGHSGAVHLNTYAHVIDALDGKPKCADLDALIVAAQSEVALKLPALGISP